MNGSVTTILIVDDHDIVREGIRKILAANSRWEVIAEARDGKEGVAKAIELKPDLVVVDFSLPLINGLEVTRQIRSHLPETEVLIFTMHDNDALIADILEAGARGYLLKSDGTSLLLEAVAALSVHRPFFTGKIATALVESSLKKRSSSSGMLTRRERGIVQLVAEGHSNKQIASILNIGLKTVETHRASVMRKLNFTSSAQLVRYAVRNKIAAP